MPGTKFKQSTLASEIEARYNGLIQDLNVKIQSESYATDEMRLDLWREQCRRQILEFAERVDDVSDLEISGFKLPYSPSVGDRRYAIRDAENEIARLTKARDKALAYVRALAPNEDGVVELYAADLTRIGYKV